MSRIEEAIANCKSQKWRAFLVGIKQEQDRNRGLTLEEQQRRNLREIDALGHRAYVVWLDDGRMKIGYTSNFAKRLEYYVQVARRHGVRTLRYWASAGIATKEEARALKAGFQYMCEFDQSVIDAGCEASAIPRHPDWFRAPELGFDAVCKKAARERWLRERTHPVFDERLLAEFELLGAREV